MSSQSLMFYNPDLQETDPVLTTFIMSQVGSAGTFVPASVGSPILFINVALSQDAAGQAIIDNFLGTVDEFPYTYFNDTAVPSAGTGVGFLLRMDGQCKYSVGVEGTYYFAATQVGAAFGRNNDGGTTGDLRNAIYTGVYGNIAGQLNITGMDAATDTVTNMVIKTYWLPK